MTNNYNVIFYNDTYKQQLSDFIRVVWDKNMTVERLTSRHQRDLSENPYGVEGGFPIAIAIDSNNTIIGHHAGTPYKMWANNKEYLSYWLAGLHVLPEGRRKGVAKALQNTTNQLPLVTSFWVIEATLKIKKRLGWTVIGKIPEYVKIINPRSFISEIDFAEIKHLSARNRRILKFLFSKNYVPARLVFIFFATIYNQFLHLFRKNALNISVHQIDNFDYQINSLWNTVKNQIKFAQIRNSEYLNWKFPSNAGWIKLIAESNSKTIGYAIVSLKDLKNTKHNFGVKVLSIIDLLWDFSQPDTFNQMLSFIDNFASESGVSLILCSINLKDPFKSLIKNGYFKIPSTVYFGYHNSTPGLTLSSRVDDWYLTRGDADAAGTLSP